MILGFCKICGHFEYSHVYLDSLVKTWEHKIVCGQCPSILETAHDFKLDNLKYLEQLYDLGKRT